MNMLSGSNRITPFLWFDKNAEEAAQFYVSIFPNSRKVGELRNAGPDLSPSPVKSGGVLTVTFELDGVRFTALNGGPHHTFTDAISFVVQCENQEEIDYYWSRLTDGGAEVACGWLRDRYGLSWQVVPKRIGELIGKPKAMQALMGMKKLVIAELETAANE